jgi:AAA domain
VIGDRSIVLAPATGISDDVPVWCWEYDGEGRIQRGTLCLFAGRPAAGKSTAARWFAAGFTRGTLDGCWSGSPQNVAYIAPAEESLKYVVKPGLRAADADLSRIQFPTVLRDGQVVPLLSDTDESALTEQLKASGVTVVIVDPIMDTIRSNVDVNKNNEVRAVVGPWARVATAIDGVVIGVVHLNKAPTGDVVAGITGSSAFGEVARSVFGFAKDPNTPGDRLMSQEKNSTGEEDLAIVYRIESHTVTTDSGKAADVGRFVLIGNADRTVGDVLQENGTGASSEAQHWLSDYLAKEGRVRSRDAKERGSTEGLSRSSVERAARKLGVVVEYEGFPRVSYWSLPTQLHQKSRQGPQADAIEVTDVTDSSHTTVTSATSGTSLQESGAASGRPGTQARPAPPRSDWIKRGKAVAASGKYYPR